MMSVKRAALAFAAIAAISACSSTPPREGALAALGAKPVATNQAILDAIDELNFRPLHTLTPAEARMQPTFADGVKAVLRARGQATLVDGVKARDMNVEGAVGPLHARILTPSGTGASKPLIVYFHGGGFVVADSAVYESSARALARETGAVVISVDYRRAPEDKFPAQHDDALASYKWAVKNAASVGADPAKVALAGESAGGNLAIATAIAAKQQGLAPPKHILAVYPLAGGDLNTPSYQENANAKPLNRAAMAWFFHHTGRAPADAADPRINLVAAELAGLPATTVILAQIDPLRSEGEMLVERLRSAGVQVEARTYAGVTHEFFGADAVIAEAKQAQMFAGERLKQSFTTR